MQFKILQNDPNLKHLSTFFKILTSLWVNEDFVDGFETYISQLNSIMLEVFKLDDASLKTLPAVKLELMKLFHILRGIVHGMNT